MKIWSSAGCSNNDIETHLNFVKKTSPGYNPKIFREMDRDGLTDTQIKIIYQNKEKLFKCSGLDYEIKFLPVCEIENFALMIAPEKIPADFWDEDNFTICSNAFDKTAEGRCLEFCKKMSLSKDESFRREFGPGKDQHFTLCQRMRENARQDKLRFYPGKTIGGRLENFNPVRIISQSIEADTVPKELENYVLEIKSFFERA